MILDPRDERASRPIVILSANTVWFVTNFCRGLIRGLRTAGYEPVLVAPEDGGSKQVLRDLQLELMTVRIDRSGANPVYDLRLVGQYRKLLKELRPAAYLGFTIKPNIYGSIAARSLAVPSIATVSGLGTAFMRRGALQWIVANLYRFGLLRAAVVFFQNAHDRGVFVDRKLVRSDQARLITGLGIDVEHFALAPLPKGGPIYLLIARLIRDKGIVEFVEAARAVRKRMPHARFQLLGPIDTGNRTAIKKAELDRWIAEGLIEYLGSATDVRGAIAGATAIVLPSYGEGMPRALLEGGAMGRPLIASDVPGCRDVVDDGISGYLCAARDSRSLADALLRLAELPEADRAAMGKAARQKVQERFSDQVVIRAYLDALAGLEVDRHLARC